MLWQTQSKCQLYIIIYNIISLWYCWKLLLKCVLNFESNYKLAVTLWRVDACAPVLHKQNTNTKQYNVYNGITIWVTVLMKKLIFSCLTLIRLCPVWPEVGFTDGELLSSQPAGLWTVGKSQNPMSTFGCRTWKASAWNWAQVPVAGTVLVLISSCFVCIILTREQQANTVYLQLPNCVFSQSRNQILVVQ